MRREGYYWVKRLGKWEIAVLRIRLNNEYWFLHDHSYTYDASQFEEIDDRIIERDITPASHLLGYTPDQV